jgi:hypothetical protein
LIFVVILDLATLMMVVMSVSMIMVVPASNLSTWVIVNVSLMQDFNLYEVKSKRH